MSMDVVVIKLDTNCQETWRYTGHVIERRGSAVLLEARFNRDDTPFHGILLGRGDRFVEIYYGDRWYNIFEIHDRDDDHLKGWYCNICKPAELGVSTISYVDLALDLLVYPDGRQLVLDEDEYDALALDTTTQRQARAALEELQGMFHPPVTFRLDARPQP